MNAKISVPKDVASPSQKQRTMYFQKLLTVAVTFLLLSFLAAQAKAQSALDGFKPSVNIWVYATVVQPDGKVVIGGLFTSIGGVARNHIARLNPDGTLDTAFDPNINGHVLSLAVQPDGKILAGGVFTNAGGQTRNNIARLDATTGMPDSFNPNANGGVEAIVVQADGKILAGGNFTAVNGQARSHIVRLDPATGLPDSFDPNPNAIVYSLAVQADGRILAGGNFTGIGEQLRNRIARLDPFTGLADSFNPNANETVRVIALQADGKVLAGGSFHGANSIGGETRDNIARLDAMTGLADSFNPGADNHVYTIAVQADGKILAGGFFWNIGGQPRRYIARLDPTTGLTDSLDPTPDAAVHSVAVQADGKVLVGGRFATIGGQQQRHIARLEKDGRLDQTLNAQIVSGPGGDGFVVATAIQPDGKILIGGQFNTVLGVTRNNIARLNTDGTLDLAFDPNANAEVDVIAVQAGRQDRRGRQFFRWPRSAKHRRTATRPPRPARSHHRPG